MGALLRVFIGASLGFWIGAQTAALLTDDVHPWLREHRWTTAYHEQLHCEMAWEHGWDEHCQIVLPPPDQVDDYGAHGWMTVGDGTGYLAEETRPSMDQEHQWIETKVTRLIARTLGIGGGLLGAIIGAFLGLLLKPSDG